jgi:hypothetical protein
LFRWQVRQYQRAPRGLRYPRCHPGVPLLSHHPQSSLLVVARVAYAQYVLQVFGRHLLRRRAGGRLCGAGGSRYINAA